MADRIVLNTPRYKGEYELDLDDPPASALEWRWVKKISGYHLATAADGWRNADPDFFIALACVALVRAGRIGRDDVYRVADELAELPFDGNTLRYIGGADEDERDAGPPAEPISAPEIEPQPESTGASSSSTWGRQEPNPSPIGAPD